VTSIRHDTPACWPRTYEAPRRYFGLAVCVGAGAMFGRQFGLAVTRTSASRRASNIIWHRDSDPDLRIVAMLTGSDWPASEAISALYGCRRPMRHPAGRPALSASRRPSARSIACALPRVGI
jgi:hypothetical protein